MATLIKIKRSFIADVVPDLTDLIAGEIAVNFADGIIYGRDDLDNIVVLGGLQDGASLPTSDPMVSGRLWNDNGTVKISV